MENAGVPVATGTRAPVTDLADAVRDAAEIGRLPRSVEEPKDNLPFCAELLDHPELASGDYDTGLVSRMRS